jgi:hypothetical protein
MATHTTDKTDNRMPSSERGTDLVYYNTNNMNRNNDFSNLIAQSAFNASGNCFTPVVNMSSSYGGSNDNENSSTGNNMYMQSNQPMALSQQQSFEVSDQMFQHQQHQQRQQQQMQQLEQDINALQSMRNSMGERSREYMGGAAAAAYNAMRQDYLDERRKVVESDNIELKQQKTNVVSTEAVPQLSSQTATATKPNPNE